MFLLTSNLLRILFHVLSLLRIRWPIEGQVSRCTLLSLPDEVLYRVFHYLDCWGIVAMRLTCGRLYAISKSHLLWQFKALEESYSSGVPLLEEPVENYTSKELEEKLITRTRTSQKWRKLDPASFQCRKIGVGYSYRTRYEFKWLPGGRWLLLNLKGCVSIMDLDAPKSTREPLFDASDPEDPLFWSAIWIDLTKCWLSPRMALHSWRTEDHEGSSRICIYQLNSTGRGLNMKWSAEEIAVIQASARGLKGGLRLEKEYVLEDCMEHNGSDYSSKAYLYQYSDGPLRSCKWDCETKSTTLLLPKGRIGVITQTHIKISVINPIGSDSLSLQPVFCTPLDPIHPLAPIYELHSTHHYSYINIASLDCMLNIQFPHDVNEVYQKRITYARSAVTSAIEGPSLLVRLLDDGSADFISYELEGGARQVASQICIHADVFRNNPALTACDMASGRLITCKHSEHMLLQV